MLAAWNLLPTDVGSARMETMDQPWHWLVLVLVSVAVLVLVVLMYRKDSVELRPGTAITLIVLRFCAFAALLAFFLNLEKRTVHTRTYTSRVMVVIDTSQSMSEPADEAASSSGGKSRIERVADELAAGELIDNFRQQHNVLMYAFDDQAALREVKAFPRVDQAEGQSEQVSSTRQKAEEQYEDLRSAAIVAAVIFAGSLALGVLFLILRAGAAAPNASWALLASVLLLIASFVWLGRGCLKNSEATAELLGITDEQQTEQEADDPLSADEHSQPTGDKNGDADARPEELDPKEIDWLALLPPKGERTYLNDTIRELVRRSRGEDKEGKSTVAAIVVFSDGGDNTEIEPALAISAAKEDDIPVYLVGLGSNLQPINLAVVDVQAPPRVLPGDDFTVEGLLRHAGMKGRNVKVELYSAPAEEGRQQEERLEQEQRVTLGKDGEEVSVKFTVTPEQLGRRVFKVKVDPEKDHNARDNSESATVQIIERKNRILMIAGGPTREFRFLRNQLHRDDDSTLDVWLQTGSPGISQEADNLLLEFPETTEEMFEYDCLIAFDPDWQLLSEDQVEILRRWVAEVAGGMIVVAGPVHTPQWANRRRGDKKIDAVKELYPVSFYGQGSALLERLGRFGGEDPWPLAFTRDGRESDFLWLADTALDSEQAWTEFEGVYGYYMVKDPKPGARIFARFSDPDTAISDPENNEDVLPIYLAGHYYGAGRVFFQASGEMWRVRAVNDEYFEKYYTKLIRWVSEGRLLRDSSRGVLLVDKDRCMPGDRVGVRAILSDAQHQPLTADTVTAVVSHDRTRATLKLQKIKGAREGMYAGQFTAMRPGKYTVEMVVPDSTEDELLTREVRVEARQLEIRKPQRQDALMRHIAAETGGQYFVGVNAAMNRGGAGTAPLYDLVSRRDQSDDTRDKLPDNKFEKVLMTWLLSFLCGVLCLEWIIRRLSKLA